MIAEPYLERLPTVAGQIRRLDADVSTADRLWRQKDRGENGGPCSGRSPRVIDVDRGTERRKLKNGYGPKREDRVTTNSKVTGQDAVDVPAGFSACHHDENAFESDGLRAFFAYRDLGTKDATGGRFGAHVIRAKPGTHAQPHWHRHDVEFQMVYVTRGWVVFEYEGVGEVRLEAGSCVHQPPGIRHRELDHSDDLELIEITSPADISSEECAAP